MPKLPFAIAMAMAFPVTAEAVYAMQPEPTMPAAPPVIQTQANPRGEGPASPTPPNPATADTPAPPAMPADPQYRGGPYAGALTPPPTEAIGKVYPLCSRTITDSCQNPSEAGLRATRHRGARHHRKPG